MIIYKILRHDEFLALETHGEMYGSSKDITDGFIHFSTKEQIRDLIALTTLRLSQLILLMTQRKQYF